MNGIISSVAGHDLAFFLGLSAGILSAECARLDLNRRMCHVFHLLLRGV